MINRTGFIPKSLIQPDKYENIFSNWNAVYITKSGIEYHVEIVADCFENKWGSHINILKQTKTGRTRIREKIPTIKKAVEILECIM